MLVRQGCVGRVLTAMLACVSGVHFYSIAVAQPRCAVRLCAAATASPSRDLAPVEVTTAQLEALQQGDVEQCYLFASPANRRNIGSADDLEFVVKSPSYQALVGCSSFAMRRLPLGLWPCGGAGSSGCCAARGLRLRERSRPGNGWGMRAEGRSVRTQRVAP